MKCDVWKPCSDQRWQDELRFSIWRFFEQSSFVNIHLLCYWPTIHNLILKICPKFQLSSCQFSLFQGQWASRWAISNDIEHWAKIVRSEKISTPIYVKCDKMYWSKIQRCHISCLTWIFVRVRQSCTGKQKNWLQVAKYDYTCTVFFQQLIQINSLVFKTGCIGFGDLGSVPDECWNCLQSLCHFVWHWAVTALTRALFILLCSL